MQAMAVDEALAHADEWIAGVTQYEGAQGWRIACATLAAEVRRLRSRVELQRGALKGASGWCYAAPGDEVSQLQWIHRGDLLMEFAGDMEKAASWPIRGVRVEGATVIISVTGGNDAARRLCGEILVAHATANAKSEPTARLFAQVGSTDGLCHTGDK